MPANDSVRRRRFNIKTSTRKIYFVNKTTREIPINFKVLEKASSYALLPIGNYSICLCAESLQEFIRNRRAVLFFPQVSPLEIIDGPRKCLNGEYYVIRNYFNQGYHIDHLIGLNYSDWKITLYQNIQNPHTLSYSELELCNNSCNLNFDLEINEHNIIMNEINPNWVDDPDLLFLIE